MPARKKKPVENNLGWFSANHIAAAVLIVTFVTGFLFGSNTASLKYDLFITNLVQTQNAQTANLLEALRFPRLGLINENPFTDLTIYTSTENGMAAHAVTAATTSIATDTASQEYIVIEDEVMAYQSGGQNLLLVRPMRTGIPGLSGKFAVSLPAANIGNYIVIEDEVMALVSPDGDILFAISDQSDEQSIINFGLRHGIVIEDIDGG